MHTQASRHGVRQRDGFTLVEIMIVVAIIGLLAAIALPNFIRARNVSQTNSCIANLKQIDGAIQEWAVEWKKNSTDNADVNGVKKYLKGSNMPVCPAGGSYTLYTVADSPTCTLSTIGHSL